MATTKITVSSASLYYGTDAEIQAQVGTIGDVGFVISGVNVGAEYTNIDGGTDWLCTRKATIGEAHVSVQESLASTDAERTLKANGAIGTNDNDVVYTSQLNLLAYNTFIFRQTETAAAAESLTVQVKLNEDDTVWSADMSIQDLTVADPGGIRVQATAVSDATTIYALLGRFYQIRVLQNGADPSNVRGQHCNSESL